MADIRTISDLTPDTHNANAGTERGRYMLEQSLREAGAGRSIVVDQHGHVIAGNKTLEAAEELGLPIVVVKTNGSELVVVQREDLDLGDERARKLAYYDNRTSEVGLSWSASQIVQDLEAGLDLTDMFRDEELNAIVERSAFDVFGETSTDRDGQGVGSTWDQVDKAAAGKVVIGNIESRLPIDIIQMLEEALTTRYEQTGVPIYETLEAIIVAGVRAVESLGS